MLSARKLACGLWQSTQDIAPSGKRCLYGRVKAAHCDTWQLAQVALISDFLWITSLAPPVPCTEWQGLHATSFFAWPRAVPPTGVFLFNWPFRQGRIASPGGK